jgi:hypothetical protein
MGSAGMKVSLARHRPPVGEAFQTCSGPSTALSTSMQMPICVTYDEVGSYFCNTAPSALNRSSPYNEAHTMKPATLRNSIGLKAAM